ncbi:hypothetical protein ACFL2J_05485 [Candidatus Omnitrophota bacterium]
MAKPIAKFRLHATRVDRIAVVDRPAVPDAEIVVFKRKDDDSDMRVFDYIDLPLASQETVWDIEKAQARLKSWAGEDLLMYRKGFMYAQDPKDIGSYELPYADIIDGTLKVVPKALFAVVQKIQGSDISSSDKDTLLEYSKRYYHKMGVEFPNIEKEMATVDFNAEFVIKATEAAVEVLQDGFFRPLYFSSDIKESELLKYWKELFMDFREVVDSVLKKVAKKVKQEDVQKLTTEEIVGSFGRGLKAVTLSEAFSFLRNNISYLILGSKRMENPDEALGKIIDDFQKFVTGIGTQIIEKKLELPETIEKVGRKISSARLKKIKDAVAVLADIISEQEGNVEKVKEAEDMELQEVLKRLDKISADVEGIVGDVGLMKASFKERGIPLTEAEKKEADTQRLDAEKKQKDADAKAETERVDAEKKATEKAEADALVALDKSRKDLGLEETATKEDIEKKQKEISEAKAKEVAEVPTRIESLEKVMKQVTEFIEVVGKRFGLKTSIEKLEEIEEDGKDKDPFATALKSNR